MTLPAPAARFLFGADGKLRPLLRAVLFYSLGTWVVLPLLYRVYVLLVGKFGISRDLTASNTAGEEIVLFLGALICTSIFAVYERRRVDSYGLPIRLALGARTWEGAAIGCLMAAAVAGGMYLLGGMQIHGWATTGSALALSAAAWLIANVCIGVAEEFWYRSYILQTLWKSIGFWPAAILIAAGFAADHYFFKAGENIWDVITIVSLSLALCYSVMKTGTLWFAVGFHIAFDFMQLFVIGTPNGSQVPVGRMLSVGFEGPPWLTGGVLGTEASFLMYPLIALLWIYIWRRFS